MIQGTIEFICKKTRTPKLFYIAKRKGVFVIIMPLRVHNGFVYRVQRNTSKRTILLGQIYERATSYSKALDIAWDYLPIALNKIRHIRFERLKKKI
jgi:hypothetical protein